MKLRALIETKISENKKPLSSDALYDLMSIVGDKLTPDDIQQLWLHPTKIGASVARRYAILSSKEKADLKQEFDREEKRSRNKVREASDRVNPTHVITCDGVLGDKFTSKLKLLRTQMTRAGMKVLQFNVYKYQEKNNNVLAEFIVSTDPQTFTEFVDEHDIDPDMLFCGIKQYKRPKLTKL